MSAPVTWSQNLETWSQIGNQPAWSFPFFPTRAIANAADMLDVNTSVTIYTNKPKNINPIRLINNTYRHILQFNSITTSKMIINRQSLLCFENRPRTSKLYPPAIASAITKYLYIYIYKIFISWIWLNGNRGAVHLLEHRLIAVLGGESQAQDFCWLMASDHDNNCSNSSR